MALPEIKPQPRRIMGYDCEAIVLAIEGASRLLQDELPDDSEIIRRELRRSVLLLRGATWHEATETVRKEFGF